MAGKQDVTLRDVKTIGECNMSMMESMMGILQSIQTQNLKIERRVGGLESEVQSLRSALTKRHGSIMADSDFQSKTTPTPTVEQEVNKELFTRCLKELSIDVKSFVKDESINISNGNEIHHNETIYKMDQLERKFMSNLDGVMTTQGNAVKKITQLVKEVQGLKATDTDMSEKLSGLIRCSAHGSIKVHQELVTLNAAAEDSRAKLSTELKTQTRSLKVNRNQVKQQLVGQLAELKDVVDLHGVTLECVKVNTELQYAEVSTVKNIVENHLPKRVKGIMQEELQGQLQKLKIEAGITHSFLKKSEFDSLDDYKKYVKKRVSVGMKVRYSSDDHYEDLVRGDVGTVMSFNDTRVVVDWSGRVTKDKCSLSYIELLG